MTHEGPNYGDIGEAHTADVDYIAGTETYDNLRNCNSTFNGSEGLFVKWTDGFNQKHVVRLHSKSDVVTVIFPVSGTDVIWINGIDGRRDRTGFDALCTWVQVKFFYVDSDWLNNHGIRLNLKGYSNIKSRNVDWDRVEKGLKAGKNIMQIANGGAGPYTGTGQWVR